MIQAACSRLLLAEQQSGGLRSADAFAAAVGHGVGAALQVDIRLERQDLGRGIHQHGDIVAAGGLGDHARAERAVVAGPGQDVDHGGALVERGFELGLVLHHDELDAQHADGMVVDVVRVGGDDDFVLQAGEVGEALHALRDCRRRWRTAVQCVMAGAAAGGDDAPLGAA